MSPIAKGLNHFTKLTCYYLLPDLIRRRWKLCCPYQLQTLWGFDGCCDCHSHWQAAVLKREGREPWPLGPRAIRYRSAGQRGSELWAITRHWISCAVPELESRSFHTCCLFPTHCEALPYHLIDLERKRRGSKCHCWFKMFQGDWKLWAMAWVRRTRPYWQGSILVKSVSHQLPK